MQAVSSSRDLFLRMVPCKAALLSKKLTINDQQLVSGCNSSPSLLRSSHWNFVAMAALYTGVLQIGHLQLVCVMSTNWVPCSPGVLVNNDHMPIYHVQWWKCLHTHLKWLSRTASSFLFGHMPSDLSLLGKTVASTYLVVQVDCHPGSYFAGSTNVTPNWVK